MTILVSACLVGVNCKYSGKNNCHSGVLKFLEGKKWVPVCPEQLGGLSTPRPPAEICDGEGGDVLNGKSKVLNVNGQDVTGNFIKGAKETLKLASLLGVKEAILKEKSPSCGYRYIYDGTFENRLKSGRGVTAALLLKEGVKVFSEEDFN